MQEKRMRDDTISRQAAIDEINERQRKLIYCFGFENDVVKIMNIAKSIITALPSAQPDLSGYSDRLWKAAYERGKAEAQDEIVRCKDCKHGSPNGRYGCKVYHYKRYETHDMQPDDFCSKGKRRTDEAD